MAKRTKRVKNPEIEDPEVWLKKLEDGKLSDFNIRDPHLLRGIGLAQRALDAHEEMYGEEGGDEKRQRQLEWNLAYAVSTAIDHGENWYGVARTLGITSAEAKGRFLARVEQLKAEREQISEEQEVDKRERQAEEALEVLREHNKVTAYENLSKEDQEAAGRLADAIAATPDEIDVTKIRIGDWVTVENAKGATHDDVVEYIHRPFGKDGKIQIVLAGPPKFTVYLNDGESNWRVVSHNPAEYQKGWYGLARVKEWGDTDHGYSRSGMIFQREDGSFGFVGTDGTMYNADQFDDFRREVILFPNLWDRFKDEAVQMLHEFVLTVEPQDNETPLDAYPQVYRSVYYQFMSLLYGKLKELNE